MTSPIRIIAHRGYSAAAPENTLAAVRAALDAGAPAVEWDLQIARCGTPVLLHDSTLDRTTDGTGPVDRRSARELAELDAGGWFGPGFAGEPVPTFRDALELVRGRVDRVYPEVKAVGADRDLEALVEAVRKAGMVEATTFISMAWDTLEALGEREPSVGLGYVVEAPERLEEALERAGARREERVAEVILDPDFRILLAEPWAAREAGERSLGLAVWTVNRPDDARRMVEMGVTGLTTDRVEELLAWAGSEGRPR